MKRIMKLMIILFKVVCKDLKEGINKDSSSYKNNKDKLLEIRLEFDWIWDPKNKILTNNNNWLGRGTIIFFAGALLLPLLYILFLCTDIIILIV